MNWYPWLNSPYRQLIGLHQAGRGHHALLIHAAEGCGDEALSYALSRWLICQRRDGIKSCGTCHSCRLMLAGTHPDWHQLTPEKGKASIGIEAVRQVIESLYAHAQQGGAKVVWLPQAELLTEAAANALLKTLEEPPAETFFLLGCRDPSRLLATLRSRCFYWHLLPPQESLSLQWLNRDAFSDLLMRRTALRLSGGAPLAAEQLMLAARWQQRLALFQALDAGLSQRDMLLLLPQLNHDDVGERLHWLSALLLDVIKWQQGAVDYLVNEDQRPLIQTLGQILHPAALQNEVQRWFACRHQLLNVVGVNRELLLTDRLLSTEQRLAEAAVHPFHLLSKS